MTRVIRRLAQRRSLVVAALMLSLSVTLAGLAMALAWRLVLSPVDVEDLDRIVVLRPVRDSGQAANSFSAARYEEMSRAGSFSVFESTAAIGYQSVTVDAGSGPIRAPVGFVTHGFFALLGRPVRSGPGFSTDDFSEGAVTVAVLSDRFWRNELGGASDVLGRQIAIAGVDATIVGIAPPGAIGTKLQAVPAAFLPLPQVRRTILHGTGLLPPADGESQVVATEWLTVLGKISPLSSVATSERQLQELLPAGRRMALEPLRQAVVPLSSSVELAGAMRLFLTASMAFLLLGCTTFVMVALLHLEARRGELAMRLALGANRWRIAALAAGEVLLVALVAILAAFPLGALALRLGSGVLLPGEIAVANLGLTLDGQTVLFFALAGLLAAGFVSAVVWIGVAANVREGLPVALKVAGAPMIAPRLRRGLVAVLLSLTVPLLGGAVFASRTASRTLAVDLGGERADRVLYVAYRLAEFGYTAAMAEQFVEALTARAVLSPVVDDASVLFYASAMVDVLYVNGDIQEYSGVFPFMAVGRGYLEALGLRIISGRGFTTGDRLGQSAVAITSASVAEVIAERNDLAGIGDVIGRTLLTPSGDVVTVVGVVDNWVYNPRDIAGRAIYILTAQHPLSEAMRSRGLPGYWGTPTFVFSVEDAAEAKRAVLAASRDLDPHVVPLSLNTAEEALRSTYILQHLAGRIMSVFSIVAMALTFISLHVLVRSIATAKRKEMAIRTALGAGVGRITYWFAAAIAKPLLVAVPCGVFALWIWFSVMSKYIVGLTSDDVGVVITTLGVALGSALGVAIGPVALECRNLPARVLRE